MAKRDRIQPMYVRTTEDSVWTRNRNYGDIVIWSPVISIASWLFAFWLLARR